MNRVLVAAIGLLLAGQLHAQNVVYKGTAPGGGSSVKIDGTSSIHGWTVEGTMIAGKLEVDPGFDADLKTIKTPPAATVKIPVSSLQDKLKQIAMDNVMRQALNTNYPNIEYRLFSLKPREGSSFDAMGALTIAGVTKTNTMPVTFERVDKSKIKVTGSTPIKMSDFNVRPPVLSALNIKTGDDVKLSFEWVVKKAEAPK